LVVTTLVLIPTPNTSLHLRYIIPTESEGLRNMHKNTLLWWKWM